jgi:hypothetical protein
VKPKPRYYLIGDNYDSLLDTENVEIILTLRVDGVDRLLIYKTSKGNWITYETGSDTFRIVDINTVKLLIQQGLYDNNVTAENLINFYEKYIGELKRL